MSPERKHDVSIRKNRKEEDDSVFGLSSDEDKETPLLKRKPSDFNQLSYKNKPKLKQFLDRLVDQNSQLHTRNQKMQMVQDMIMNFQEQDPSADSDFRFEIDGLSALCTYLFFSIGTLNSHINKSLLTTNKNL